MSIGSPYEAKPVGFEPRWLREIREIVEGMDASGEPESGHDLLDEIAPWNAGSAVVHHERDVPIGGPSTSSPGTAALHWRARAIEQLASIVVERLAIDVSRRAELVDLRRPRPETQDRFARLAALWRRETRHLSSLHQAALHPAYQKMIGIGPEALPLIFSELRQKPEYWFWALTAITDEDPAEGITSFDGARRAWLDWAESRGY